MTANAVTIIFFVAIFISSYKNLRRPKPLHYFTNPTFCNTFTAAVLTHDDFALAKSLLSAKISSSIYCAKLNMHRISENSY
jgi:hypothetical protein